MHKSILTEDEISLLNSYLSLFPVTVSAQSLRDKFQDVIRDAEIRPIQLLSRRNTCAYLISPGILDYMLKVLKDDVVQSVIKDKDLFAQNDFPQTGFPPIYVTDPTNNPEGFDNEEDD
ncbi:MAG: hypothetical protein ACRC6U_07400 [Fusobacteriaceae bacterium]